ncbi:MAG: glycosyltransferase [Candidatus Omnitrophota bacterium]
MISPSRQKIIQIDITNACPHQCANCTRFVGHHQKPFFMPVDSFKQAVDSLKGYSGMVGVMGGEPTLHPQFAEIVDYLVKTRPDLAPPPERYDPIKNFVNYRNLHLSSLRPRNGLWTSLGKFYYKHYELIQDSFSYQCVNDHTHVGEHLALLVTRKELGFSDEEWLKLRDNCWVQKEWSSSITPKGAFFCEVAGALDMLFNGPGGWPIEDGWWKREPKDFGEQLKWCEMCSACLPVPRAVAASGKDIVSPLMREKLESIGSLKLKKGMVDVLDLKKYAPAKYKVNYTAEPYLPDGDNAVRVSSTNQSLVPQKIEAVVVCAGYGDYLSITLPFTKNAVDKVIVVTDEKDLLTQNVCKENDVECIISSRLHENGAAFAKGKGVNHGIDSLKHRDWVLILDADIILPKDFAIKIRTLTLNPGALYYARRWGPRQIEDIEPFVKQLSAGTDSSALYDRWANKLSSGGGYHENNAVEELPFGYFQLFNLRAKILQGREKIYIEESDSAEWDDGEFQRTVYLRGRVKFLPKDIISVIHLPHGRFRTNWTGRKNGLLNVKNPLPVKQKEDDGGVAENLNTEKLSVSVIVYAFNNKTTIDRCLEALIKQDFFGEREVIVVDNTAGGATCASGSYPGVQLIQECFEGRAHARNVAIAQAKGDIFLFCDADCQPEKDWITRLTAPFKSDANIGSVAGGVSYVKMNNIVGRYYQLKIPFSMNDLIMSEMLKVSPVMSNVAYRKVVFENLGFFDVSFGNACEDFGLWYKINQSKKYLTRSLFGAIVYYLNPTVRSIWENYFDFYVGLNYMYSFYELRRRPYKFLIPVVVFIFSFPLYLLSMPFLLIYIVYKRFPVYMVVFPWFEFIRVLATRLGVEDGVSYHRVTLFSLLQKIRKNIFKSS